MISVVGIVVYALRSPRWRRPALRPRESNGSGASRLQQSVPTCARWPYRKIFCLPNSVGCSFACPRYWTVTTVPTGTSA